MEISIASYSISQTWNLRGYRYDTG